MRHREQGIRLVLWAAAAVLVLGGVAIGQQPAAGNAPKTGAPRKGAGAAGRQGGGWPRKVPFGEFTLVIEEPQAESLQGTKLKAHGAFEVKRGEEEEVTSGTAWYDAEVEIDRDQRTVMMASTEVPKVEMAGAPPQRQQRVSARLKVAFNNQRPRLSLDTVLAETRIARGREEAAPKLNTEPPKIVFETEPAILVIFDGEPRFRAVDGSKLERALNTPFLVLRDPGDSQYYLSGGTMWFRAASPAGPWTKTDRAPAEAVQIAKRDLKEGGVADSDVEEAKQSADKRVPRILVATEPTELIVSDGPPRWTAEVPGELEALANSENDVFRTLPDQQYYLVLSGRWYRSDAYSGPWKFIAPDQLPASFRKISKDSAKADALASVPGTAAARDALEDANTPRTAAIKRSEARVAVTYDGDPKFEAVPGTKVEYALNTGDQVLKIRGRYYVCDKGVWFAADSPTGPWAIADSIPEDEIQTIPPESPVYNTRFAYVYDSTPELVYTAYTPGYLGSYPYYGTVVFGTGWAYRPWWGAAYYPRFWTWGFHARYAPWVGWGYGFGWGPAWGGFRYGFGWGWGARWAGPGGFFRPAYRNVNITRNVNINRNVNVNRNVYNSSRTNAATARANATNRTTRQVGNRANPNARAGQGAQRGQAHAQAPGNRGRAGAGAKGARPAPHAGGGRHGGGGRKH